jgi:hypothetical protein
VQIGHPGASHLSFALQSSTCGSIENQPKSWGLGSREPCPRSPKDEGPGAAGRADGAEKIRQPAHRQSSVGFFYSNTFAPIGPYIVTADEIKDPHNLQVRLTNNGVVMQNFNTDDMAHKIPHCIEWVTSIHTLQPGDILATGTNHRGLNPFMDGDKIELTCEGCGTLHITVRDDLKRTPKQVEARPFGSSLRPKRWHQVLRQW